MASHFTSISEEEARQLIVNLAPSPRLMRKAMRSLAADELFALSEARAEEMKRWCFSQEVPDVLGTTVPSGFYKAQKALDDERVRRYRAAVGRPRSISGIDSAIEAIEAALGRFDYRLSHGTVVTIIVILVIAGLAIVRQF